jgi:hypothetical protein
VRRALFAGALVLALGGCGGGSGDSSQAITGSEKDRIRVYLQSIAAQCALRAVAAEEGQTTHQLEAPLTPRLKASVNFLIAKLDAHADETLDVGPENTHPLKDFVRTAGVQMTLEPPLNRNCWGGDAIAAGRRMIDAAEARGARAP